MPSQEYTNEIPSLEQLFWSSLSRSAKDPRDYVYALYGPRSHRCPRGLLPDYDQPAERAYQNAMLTIMMEAGNLDFLSVKLLQRNQTTPSWCLHFSAASGLADAKSAFKTIKAWLRIDDVHPGEPPEPVDPPPLFQYEKHKISIALIGWNIDEVFQRRPIDITAHLYPTFHSEESRMIWLLRRLGGLQWRLRSTFPPKNRFESTSAPEMLDRDGDAIYLQVFVQILCYLILGLSNCGHARVSPGNL